MRILQQKPQESEIRIVPESVDDLWELSHIFVEGDLVRAKTERKIALGTDRTKQVRKPMTLTIRVTDVQFEHEILRIQGTITDGPEDLISFGDHHTLGVHTGTELIVEKNWDSLAKKRLDRAVSHIPRNVLLVTFDREEAHLAELTRQGYSMLQHLKGNVAKKAPGGGAEDFWKTLADAIVQLDSQKNYTTVIVASPAFWTDYLLKALPDTLRKKTTAANCSTVGEAALHEVLQRPELKEVLSHDQRAQEEQVVAQVLEAVSKDVACYGIADCTEKVQLGQVKLLCVTMQQLMRAREDGTYEQYDALLQQAQQMQAETHILEYAQDQVQSMGGIAGVLRW